MTTLLEAEASVEAALLGVPNLLVLSGGVPDDQQMPRDDAGQANPYAVIYLGAGRAWSDRHGGLRQANAAPLNLAVAFQVTAAAGTYEGALWAVGKVRTALTGLRLFGGLATPIREITDPGVVRRDETVPSDVRWYLPMQYRFTTTTT